MKVIRQIVAVIGLGVCCLQPAAAAPVCKPNLTVVAAERVHKRTPETRARELLCVLAALLDIGPELPRIVLLQVSSDEAAIAGITRSNPIHEEHLPGRPGLVYYVWLIGDHDDDKLAVLLASSLADATGQRLSREDLAAAVHRAVLSVGAKVSTNSLLRHGH